MKKSDPSSHTKMIKLLGKSCLPLALLSTVVQFCFCQVSSITCNEAEREALLKLRRSFADPSNRLASWRGTDCCNWDGVGCNETTGHVIKIDLRNNQIYSHALSSNSIDSGLLELKYLNYLDLSWNFFNYSKIPNFLGLMLELRYLNLSHASFQGKVPPRLGNLTKLVVLDLSFNDYFINRRMLLNYEGEWISRLSSLQFLDLGGMNFNEASNLMQVVSSLPLLSLRLSSCSLQNGHFSYGLLNSSFLARIQLLDLSLNNFNGLILEAFQNMTSLKSLYLSRNGFGGPIPLWFRNFRNLVVLSLEQNMFTSIEGGFSSIIRNNCGLKVFDLSENYDLGGDVFGSYENNVSLGCNRYDLQVLDLHYTSVKNKIPDWLGKFENLQSLNLRNSYIYGPIPVTLGNLSSVEDLDLSGNDLSRAIPTSFGRLLNLRNLDLAANILDEVGVECFSQLENLEVLDISQNLLQGIVSEAHFSNLSQLHTLRIGQNSLLSFDTKDNWVPPFQLKFLYAASCMGFGTDFPRWFRTQKSLVVLQLLNTSISGTLPTWLRGQNLTTLDLSHNQINGPLTTSIGDQMPNLQVLLLNDNHINGSLPPSICKLKNLKALDLSNNGLSGMVHGCFMTSNLLLLDLSSNKFSGMFPYSSGNLSSVQQLYLTNNNFEGCMPTVLRNSTSLTFLDLEGNKFSGNIPTWVGDNLGNLQFLKLRGNFFNGTIPLSLCLLTYLQVMDLAHNQLEGNILPNLNNFSVMTGKMSNPNGVDSCVASNIYCNYMQKTIRQYFKLQDLDYSLPQLRLMVNIDLSKNYLVGPIPSEITTLKGLVGLNLSHNNLTDTIPTKMGEIEALQSLDLSFNQISGPIPKSMSKLSFLGVLRLSHNNLSGDIPREGQLSTFNEASSFDGNPFLCGDPLLVKCGMKEPFEPPSEIENVDQEEDKWEKKLLCIMVILGYVLGLGATVGVLILKRSWRYAYFKFVDEAKYKIHETMSSSVGRLKGNRIFH